MQYLITGLMFLGVSIFAVVMGIACGGYADFAESFKVSFTPRSMKDFLFPACPFCWVARFTMLFAIVNFTQV